MGAIIAAMAAERQRLIALLTDAGATSAERAVALDELRPDLRRSLRDLTANGSITMTADGRYFLDAPRLAARKARARRAAGIILGVTAVAVILILLVGYLQSARR